MLPAPQLESLDNNLPSTYKSKLDRLNTECADPLLSLDCVPGQKWKCINESGRWRKHKCKFHLQLQNHLAQINKILSAQQNKKNCACFTPNGVVYTKGKNDRDIFSQHRRVEQRQNVIFGRQKRHIEADEDVPIKEVYSEEISPEMLDLVQLDKVIETVHQHILNVSEDSNTRKKRDTSNTSSDYITSVIDELHNVLDNIEKKFNNQKLETSDKSGLPGPAQCFVEATGQVNCSNIIYEDEKAWKKSRVQVDLLLRVLKNKINNLKEIKKHLKENRPSSLKEYDEDLENSSLSQEDDTLTEKEQEYLEELETTKKPKKPANDHRHQHHQGRRKKPKETNNEEGPLIDMSYFVTDSFDESSLPTEEAVPPSSSTTKTTTSTSQKPFTTRAPHQRHSKHRHRTTKTSSTSTTTTTTEMPESQSVLFENSEEYSGFSSITSTSAPDFNFDYYSSSDSSDTSTISTTTTSSTTVEIPVAVTSDFNEASVSVDATIIEPKHRHHKHFLHQNILENSNNVPQMNFTNEFPRHYGNTHRHSHKRPAVTPTDCFCEPEVER